MLSLLLSGLSNLIDFKFEFFLHACYSGKLELYHSELIHDVLDVELNANFDWYLAVSEL